MADLAPLLERITGLLRNRPADPGKPLVTEMEDTLTDGYARALQLESERLRLEMYKRLSEVRTDEDVDQIRDEMVDRYGQLPEAVSALLLVANFRARARQAGIGEITIMGKHVRFAPVELPDSRVVRLGRIYPGSLVKAPVKTILVPRPQTAVIGGKPITGIALLEWARHVIDAIIDPAP